MSLTLYYHPLSSFCWKPLVALYEKGIEFTPHLVDLSDASAREAFIALWPMGQFPVLWDEARGKLIPQSASIIEYLEFRHPKASPLIPADAELALEVRGWNDFFDSYLQLPMQKIVGDVLRPAEKSDPFGVAEAHATLQKAYGWLDDTLQGKNWMVGDAFSMAECAAAPALFYANKVAPFSDVHTGLGDYLDRLKARPSFARVLQEAEPWFHLFPIK